MVGQPLELEREAAQPLGPCGGLASREGLHRPGVRQRVPHGRVACHRLHVVNRPLVGAPDESRLHAAILVAEGDLEVQHRLAVTLKPKVARLDDPRVDGAHGNLVDFLPLDGEEGHDRRPH